MRTVAELSDLQGKTVFLRVDFDVPVVDGVISESFRISRQKETLHYLLDHGARVVMAAHISAVPSFEPLKPQLEKLLGVSLGDKVRLLENLRQHPGEEANDSEFAAQMVAGCDIYVNNAFAVCHRAHASVDAASRILPSYAGLLIEEETRELATVMDAPTKGKVVFMGGAKASTKAPVIRYMLCCADSIAVGGIVANDILHLRGVDIGVSHIDADAAVLLEGVDVHAEQLVVPTDWLLADGQIADIGAETTAAFAALAQRAATIIWNGPMGKFENAAYAGGTHELAKAIAVSGARTVIGGGDTIAAVNQLGILDQYSFVSTGGGAMLAFLAGEQLPGLVALGYIR